MRTVLAVDEMLADAIAPKLPGVVERMGHMAMRETKGTIIARLRRMLTSSPSVMAIGAREWDALPMLRRLLLPRETPTVLLARSMDHKTVAEARSLGVFSIVPLDGSVTGISSAVAVELQLAEMWQAGFLERPLLPVVVWRPRATSSVRPHAAVLRPRFPQKQTA